RQGNAMDNGTLSIFIDQTRTAFGPLTTERLVTLRAELERLTRAPASEPWLRALHEEAPASKQLYRDRTHGFLLLAHSEPAGLYRPPHDHGRAWVIYALQRGAMEIGTYARVQDGKGRVRLVQRDTTLLRAGDARVYLPGDIHDTRCTSGPSLLLRFTERDLGSEQEAPWVTRYVAGDGFWTVGT
ncbi:MAG TPA: hypothetical protein VG963_20510, partial [Polyangiaceae bacterium]|nr:hypothetical protein [Polyangiaceae bacterium]